MAKLALIGTFYKRYDQSRACVQRVMESTRVPDEILLLCETQDDADNLKEFSDRAKIEVIPTPKTNDEYDVVPYSNKINWGLNHTDADLIAYLDNGSMPHIEKYQRMAEALENNDFGAVYCTQKRTGFIIQIHHALMTIQNPYAVINYTQGMHRKTDKRWSTDMQFAKPHDLVDAMFWQSLGVAFHPVAGEMILDEHHMESSMANGL